MSATRILFVVVGALGALMAVLAIAGVDQAVIYGLLDPGVGFHTTDVGGRLGFGISGALMVAWAITGEGWFAGRDPVRTVRISGLAWFLLDSAASLASGMWPNVLFNVVFLVGIVLATAAAPQSVRVRSQSPRRTQIA